MEATAIIGDNQANSVSAVGRICKQYGVFVCVPERRFHRAPLGRCGMDREIPTRQCNLSAYFAQLENVDHVDFSEVFGT